MTTVPREATLVFLHLQKTGGSTVHEMLTKHFSSASFAKKDRTGRIVLAPADEQRDQIISGHVTACSIKQLGVDAWVTTVLRDPVARLLSHFHFLKTYTREHLATYQNPGHHRIKEMNLHAFLRDPQANQWCRDFYVKRLDPEYDLENPDDQPPDVERALAFLKSCKVVGIMPRLAAFVREVFQHLGLAAPEELPFVNRRSDLESQEGFEPVIVEAPSQEDRILLEELTRNDRILVVV